MLGRPFLQNLAFAVTGIAVGLIAAVAVYNFYDNRSAPEIVIDDPRDGGEMVVSVDGEVATPGTYRLVGDARLQDAVDAAGGTTDDADLSSINMASRINDEDQIFIPSKQSAAQGLMSGTAPPAETQSTLVNINSATAAELNELPGIGDVLAARIIEYRDENGPFESIDELAQVDGISLGMVDELRSLITV